MFTAFFTKVLNHAYPIVTGWRFGVTSAENCRLGGVGGLQRLFEGAQTHTNLAEADEPVLTGYAWFEPLWSLSNTAHWYTFV